MGDPHDLQRFVEAQSFVYQQVVRELTAGSKQTHWIWFIFPQIAGLGTSFRAVNKNATRFGCISHLRPKSRQISAGLSNQRL